jgi:hypothetical protein
LVELAAHGEPGGTQQPPALRPAPLQTRAGYVADMTGMMLMMSCIAYSYKLRLQANPHTKHTLDTLTI